MEDVIIIIFCLVCGLMGFVVGYCLGYEKGEKGNEDYKM